MKNSIRVCLIGIGRTGQEIARTIMEQEDLKLVMAVCRSQSAKDGMTVNDLLNIDKYEVMINSVDSLEENLLKNKPDVVIDFSVPEATLLNAKILGNHNIPIVIGTNGFSEDQTKELTEIASQYDNGIIHAPNITLGVNVLMVLTNLASSILQEYDCEIIESHFKDKKDAPSGTAKKIALEALKGQAFHNENIDTTDYNAIPIHAVRAGGIVGSHKVILAGQHDKIEITHESFSRRIFALGAMKAVKFIVDKKGFYTMHDVLDMNRVVSRYLEMEGSM